MIHFVRPTAPLSLAELRQRRGLIFGIAGALLTFTVIDSVSVGRWSWLPTSCGAVTGLPCVFCGLTRALHYLCVGEFSRALYFNWMAFPAVALALAAIGVAAFELAMRARVVRIHIVISPRLIGATFATIAALWVLQVYLAVHNHKAELLNPRGPLYALFVR